MRNIFEKGNLQQYVLEYEKRAKNSSLHSLSFKEQLMVLFYEARTLELLRRYDAIKELLRTHPFLNSYTKDQKPVINLLINLIKIQLFFSDENLEKDSLLVYQQSDKLVERLSEEEKIQDAEILGFYFSFKALNVGFKKNSKNNGLEYIRYALNLQDATKDSYVKCYILVIFGLLYARIDDYKNAISYTHRAKEIAERIGANERLLTSLINLSSFFTSKSDENDLDKAISYLHKAKELNKEVGRINNTENNLSLIYIQKGEISLALETVRDGLKIYKKFGFKHNEASALSIMGDIYYQQGLFKEAKESFKQSLIAKPRGSTWTSDVIFNCLFRLFQISLKENDTKKADQYLNEIQVIQQEFEPGKVSIYEKLAKGIVLKNGKRMRDRVKSQEIFEEISNDNDISIKFRTLAINYIIELILDDYILLGDDNALSEVKTLITKLYGIGQDSQNFPVIIQSLILQARIKMLEDDFREATKLLGVANLLASERGLSGLQKDISKETALINDDTRKIINKAKSKREGIEILQITNYIQEAQRFIIKDNKDFR